MPVVEIQKQVGKSVREARIRLALSQEELAERAGLHRTYVSDVERGARNISIRILEKLANAIGASPTDFFDPKAKPPVLKPKTADSRRAKPTNAGGL